MVRGKFGAIWRLIAVVLMMMISLSACAVGKNGVDRGTPTVLDPTATTESQQDAEATASATQALEDVVDAGWLASEIRSARVTNSSGEPFARVSGFILDAASGYVQYLIIEGERFGDQQVLAPWAIFDIKPVQVEGRTSPGVQFQSQLDPESLTEAPAYSEGILATPGSADQNWDQAADKYWSALGFAGQSAGAEGQEPQPVVLGSDGLRRIDDVLDENDIRVSELEDLVIDTNGVVRFALMELDSSIQQTADGQDAAVVVWRALRLLENGQGFRLLSSPDRILQGPHLDLSNMPDLSLPGWDQAWTEYWRLSEAPQPTQTTAAEQPADIPVGDDLLLGRQIVSVDGDPLGVIEDWLIDTAGTIRFLAVTTPVDGGYVDPNRQPPEQQIPARSFNPGVSWVLIPWSEVVWDYTTGSVIFQEAPDVFTGAPNFDSADTLDAFQSWSEPVGTYWEEYVAITEPAVEDSQSETIMVWISSLVDVEIDGVEDASIGKVRGMLLESDGKLLFLVIDGENRFKPVPWRYFEPLVGNDPMNINFIYTDDPDRLDEAPAFDTVDAALHLDAAQTHTLRTYWGLK